MLLLASVLLSGSVGANLLPSVARASSCLSDAEIDVVVGAAVRARAPTIDTRALPDIPLCSGLTLAQRIQRMRAEAFPNEAARAQAERQAAIAQEEQSTREVSAISDVKRPSSSHPQARLSDTEGREFPRRAAPPRTPERIRAAAPHQIRRSTYYPSCRLARAAGVTPIRRGSAGYSAHLDRDGDGIACE